eukprot:GSA25T00024356001.1
MQAHHEYRDLPILTKHERKGGAKDVSMEMIPDTNGAPSTEVRAAEVTNANRKDSGEDILDILAAHERQNTTMDGREASDEVLKQAFAGLKLHGESSGDEASVIIHSSASDSRKTSRFSEDAEATEQKQ